MVSDKFGVHKKYRKRKRSQGANQENLMPHVRNRKIVVEKSPTVVPGEPIVVDIFHEAPTDAISWNFLHGPTNFRIGCKNTLLLPSLQQFPSFCKDEEFLPDPTLDSEHLTSRFTIQIENFVGEMQCPVANDLYASKKELPVNFLNVRFQKKDKFDLVPEDTHFNRDWWTKICKNNSKRYFMFLSLCRTIPEKFEKLKCVEGWKEEYVSFLSFVKYMEREHSDLLEMDIHREPFMYTCDTLNANQGEFGMDEISCNVSFNDLVQWLKREESLNGRKRQDQCLALRNTLL